MTDSDIGVLVINTSEHGALVLRKSQLCGMASLCEVGVKCF